MPLSLSACFSDTFLSLSKLQGDVRGKSKGQANKCVCVFFIYLFFLFFHMIKVLLPSCNCSLVSLIPLSLLSASLTRYYATVFSCKSLQDLSFGCVTFESETGFKASHSVTQNHAESSLGVSFTLN